MGRKRVEDETDAAPPALDPQPQLPWGMEKTEMQPSSLTSLTDDKLARFVLGHQKKTKFQKEREDREAKKRRADEEAAKIYATFVASFDNEGEAQGKTFVRSAAALGDGQSTQEHGETYRLEAKEAKAGLSAVFAEEKEPLKVSEMDQTGLELQFKEADKMQQSGRDLTQVQKPKKRRAIDEFLEEMKERGPAPVSLEGTGLAKGSFDDGNPETTNLYVGNLAPSVTEEVLEAEFGRYGDVYSVKIMWPRSEEERARKRNCGFVSFYERRDADDARVNLDNKELEGQPMIVGWGKAVAIQPRKHALEVLLPPVVALPSATDTTAVSAVKQTVAAQQTITVEMPTEETRWRVDHLARYVATDGLQFENAVRTREANNRDYAFLFDHQCTTALYYRWRVYSFAMGDDETSWRETPFQMTTEGPVWVPPKMPPRAYRSRSRGSASRSSGRSRHGKSTRSCRRDRSESRSYSQSRSRSSSPSPSRFRQKKSRSGSRRRRRSFSSDEDRGYRRSRRRSSRSRSRGRRSRSWSSDNPSSRKSSRRTRSRSRRNDKRRDEKSHERSRRKRREEGLRGQEGDCVAKNENLLTGQQIARARDVARGRERNRLSDEDYGDFTKLLDELTLERDSVKRAMGFALDKSEAAVDLVGIIMKSFTSSSSSGVALVGLLYVTSDILHNSSAAVKNASLFRTTFQECLPEAMHKLRCVHKNIGGRMSANAMKEKVMNVLSAWESWSLFPPAVLLGLHATFLRKTEEEEYLAARNLNVEGIGEADLERLRKTCRQSGVLSTGDAKQLVARLQWLKEFTSPTTSIDPGQAVATKKLSAHSSDEVVTLGVSMSRADTAIARRIEGVDRETAEVDGKVSDEVAVGGEVLVDGGRTVDGRARVDGKSMDAEELDGEPFDEDVDEGKLADEDDLDGEPLDEDADEGEPVSEEDLDGEPLDEDADMGEPVDEEDLDGEPLDVDVGGPDSELFGGDVNEVELDGEPLDSDDLDGVPMDGGLDAGSM